MSACGEWWWWCARPGRLPRAAPLSILLATVLTLISLLFLLNAKALNRHSSPRQVLELEDHDLEGAPQHHPDLVTYIRQLHLVSPSLGPYNLHSPNTTDFSQNGQSRQIEEILKGKAGAYNGEELSNTLYLERQLGWRGLLVEPDPWNFWALRKRGRRAHSIHACLSPYPFPREVTFKQSDTMGHIVNGGDDASRHGIFTRVKCFPLYSLLLALNTTRLDLLSLDVEGAELQVLRTVPWEAVRIEVICVEYRHVPEGKLALSSFLQERGYTLHSTLGDDYIFVRRDLERPSLGIL
ncbi:protein Star-like isoform X2 [Homarus americanus]|uniref:protein Star-like isoform X2 n=1 Tax=Homarus americanus TaxID=6706 RepID=UPI001C4519C4|nr:protein Star-like isoform X2 [Homarus americanus]